MDMDKDFLALTRWLEETRSFPLESMASFFDARIGEYEEHMSPWQQHYAWMANLLQDGIKTLLDIGCGSGLELDQIFGRFPGLQVTGIDLSSEMLAKLAEKHRNRRLKLIQADYFSYDLGKNVFDAAVSFETLHHFHAQKKQMLFSKIYHSLTPGGVYLECDYIARTEEIESLLFAECALRRERDSIPPDVYVHFDTPLTVEHEMGALSEAGFPSVELLGYLPEDANTAMIRAIK